MIERERVTAAESARPNPVTGKQAGRAYAEAYAAAHQNISDFELRLWNSDLLVIDSLLSNYAMLDVGCGTGGDLRILRNHRRVLAVDFSEHMIEEAERLAPQLGLARIEFRAALFQNLVENETFDVVRIRGTVGCYEPWPGNEGAIDKVKRLLVPNGIAIASYYRPPNLIHSIKSVIAPRQTLAITERRFRRMWESRGFAHLLTMMPARADVVLFKNSTVR